MFDTLATSSRSRSATELGPPAYRNRSERLSPGAVSKREASKAKAIELYQGGMQRAQIAARLEMNPDYVSNLLRGVVQVKGRPSVMAAGLGLPAPEPAPKRTLPAVQVSTTPAAPPV